jgi:hypothetical protein
MSIKLALLKSGETVISDIKQLTNENSTVGYLFKDPHKVTVQKNIILCENESNLEPSEREVQVTLSPWILLSKDKEMVIPTDWIVTVVNPLSSVQSMYEEKVNEPID